MFLVTLIECLLYISRDTDIRTGSSVSEPYGELSSDETGSQTFHGKTKPVWKPKKRPKPKKDPNFENTITDLLRQQSADGNNITKLMLEKSDEDHFFESCSLRMKKLSRKEKGAVQIKIMQLLHEAECADEESREGLPNIVAPKHGRLSSECTTSKAHSDFEKNQGTGTCESLSTRMCAAGYHETSTKNISSVQVLSQSPVKNVDINMNIKQSKVDFVSDPIISSAPAFTTIDGTAVMLDGSTAFAYLVANCSDGQIQPEENSSKPKQDILEVAMEEIMN